MSALVVPPGAVTVDKAGPLFPALWCTVNEVGVYVCVCTIKYKSMHSV